MKYPLSGWLSLLLLLLLHSAVTLHVEYPYCFRFTWIGPFQDKNNIASLTCEHLREDLNYVPCRRPLVATDNDAEPDTEDLWRNNREKPSLFGCPMVPGEACVKYTYTYNKGVQNITYMCAKVNATSGCYRQRYISGLEVEVCVCDSQLGALPCNYGSSMQQCGSLIIGWLLLWRLIGAFVSVVGELS